MKRRRLGLAGCLGIVFGVSPAIVVLSVRIGLYQLHERTVPPDVRATAQSAAVAQSDGVATNAISADLDRPARGSSWLTPGPSAVSDVCRSRSPGAIGASWGPVSCVRELIRLYAFDGALPQRYALLVAELSGTPVAQNRGPLADNQTLYHSSAGPDGLSLVMQGRFADTTDAVGSAEYGGTIADADVQFVRQSEPLNARAAARAMLSSHRDLLILAITCWYYPTPAGA